MSFLSFIVTWTYINIFCVSPHPPSVSAMYTQTHRDTGIKSAYVTDRFAIQFKAVRRLIMSEDFWDTLKLATLVLKPALVALSYDDGMKGDTVTLLYNLLLELDIYYSKPIKGLDEAMRKKMHNVFMSRWSAFHAPIHSAAFAMDKQFCRREMDHGVKTDIWSVMEDFSKAPGGQDFSKLKSQYALFVDALGSKQVFQYVYHMRLCITVSIVTDNIVYVVSV